MLFENSAKMTGRTLSVMIEGRIPEDEVYIGRTYMDAPDVDGYVFVNTKRHDLMSGDIVTAVIDGAEGYDLTAAL